MRRSDRASYGSCNQQVFVGGATSPRLATEGRPGAWCITGNSALTGSNRREGAPPTGRADSKVRSPTGEHSTLSLPYHIPKLASPLPLLHQLMAEKAAE